MIKFLPPSSPPPSIPDVQTERRIEKEVLTEGDLDKVVSIQLTETDTIRMLDLPAICLSAESDEAVKVKERNEKYKEVGTGKVCQLGEG